MKYTSSDVRAMWACARVNNHSIPDGALDAMKADLLDKVQAYEKAEEEAKNEPPIEILHMESAQ